MDNVALLSSTEREALFQEAANQKGLSLAVIEKDFWVCWTLKRVFAQAPFGEHLIFKGGTSLSKVFGLIERFSEDIDLSIRRDYLGAVGDQDPEQDGLSKTQRRGRVDALRASYRRCVQEEMLPALQLAFAEYLPPSGGDHPVWSLDADPTDEGTLLFSYPSAQTAEAPSYLRRQVKIEMGAGSDPFPIGTHRVRSYAAERFPTLFSEPEAAVVVLEAERTFWEKATLLHAECHRAAETLWPLRLSRHYYDLMQLASHPVGEKALADPSLRERFVQHKSVYFASSWAHYETAQSGSFRLIPDEPRLAELRQDYARMRDMFFRPPPSFNNMIQSIRLLEDRINLI